MSIVLEDDLVNVSGECVEVDGAYFLGGEFDGEDQRLFGLWSTNMLTIEPEVVRVIDVRDGHGRLRKGNVRRFAGKISLVRKHEGGILNGTIQ
jgi:hypothetical protein